MYDYTLRGEDKAVIDSPGRTIGSMTDYKVLRLIVIRENPSVIKRNTPFYKVLFLRFTNTTKL